MEFNFEKVTDTVKKKPALIFGVVGAGLGLLYLLFRGQSSAATTSTGTVAADGVTQATQAAQGAADNSQLYSDVYGLVAQSQDATLQQVESMFDTNNTSLYNALAQNLAEAQAANSAEMAGLSSTFQSSLTDWTSKFNALQPDAPGSSAALQTAQAVPTTNISAPSPAQLASPTASASVVSSLLKVGSSGSAVSALQNQLNALGFSAGSVDGSFGPKTLAAVKSFQSAAGITADGIVGDQTRAALATYQPKVTTIPGSGGATIVNGALVNPK